MGTHIIDDVVKISCFKIGNDMAMRLDSFLDKFFKFAWDIMIIMILRCV